MPSSNQQKIDVHHHFVTDGYRQALENAGGDPSGSWTPQWNLETDDAFCDELNIGATIFSLTSPGAPIAGEQGSISLARTTNDYLASVRDKNPLRYGFFACMPDLRNTEAALAEIEHALDILKADGIMLMTRYGSTNMYLGHEAFAPIWSALNARNAVVLIHPTHSVDTNLLAKNIPQPIVDYPHETTRAAVDIIMSNGRRMYPEVKVILAHAGGTLPYLAKRLAALSDVGLVEKSVEEVHEDIASFYFDVALSSSKQTIETLLACTTADHILYGSDYPYAPRKTIDRFAKELDESTESDPDLAFAINKGNALKLFPRFST